MIDAEVCAWIEHVGGKSPDAGTVILAVHSTPRKEEAAAEKKTLHGDQPMSLAQKMVKRLHGMMRAPRLA